MELLELAFKISFCLLLAGLIGWIVGFLLGRIFGSANATQLLNACESRMRMRDQDLAGLRSDLTTANAKTGSLETELATLATTLKTRDGWVSEMEEKNKDLQADLDARISELDELKAESEQAIADLKAQLEKAVAGAEWDALRVRVAEAEGAVKSLWHDQGELNTLRVKFAAQEQELAKARALGSQLQSREAESATSTGDKDAEIARLKVRLTELELMVRGVKEPVVKVSHASSLPSSTKEGDDLKKIFGIGPVLEKALNSHGIYWFRQIADWTSADVQRYDTLLEDFRGRIERDNWISGAQQEHQKKYGQQL